MKLAKDPESYIEGHPQWSSELKLLRSIITDLGLPEVMKWGTPTYTVNGKNVVGLGAFKSYVGLWFHQGIFLKDEHKVLMNAQEGTTKALRQMRFTALSEIDPDIVKTYVLEAVENQKQNKEIKPKTDTSYTLPQELKHHFDRNPGAKEAFELLSPGKRKEYANYVDQAKQQKTRDSRVEKIAPMIERGIGLNDKYRK